MEQDREAAPTDIAAEFAKMLDDNGAGPSHGAAESDDALATALDGQPATEDGDAEFEVKATDLPDVADLKRQLKRTMTKKTMAVAEERKQIAKQREAYDQAIRDAEAYRLVRDADDPAGAVKALVGNRGNGNGHQSYADTLKSLEGEFEPKTFDAITKLSTAIAMQAIQQQVGPYAQIAQQYVADRQGSEWRNAVSEFGDDATKWKDAAAKIQSTTGLSLSDALLVASKGQVALGKIRAKIQDARKRAPTPATAPGATEPTGRINLTREQRNQTIMQQAAALGMTKYARP